MKRDEEQLIVDDQDETVHDESTINENTDINYGVLEKDLTNSVRQNRDKKKIISTCLDLFLLTFSCVQVECFDKSNFVDNCSSDKHVSRNVETVFNQETRLTFSPKHIEFKVSYLYIHIYLFTYV